MDEKRVKILIDHWLETVEEDLKTVEGLFEIGRFVGALFWGHLLLEKIIKVHVIKTTREEAPKHHNLVRLAELAGLNLSKDELAFLGQVNDFNIAARYPEVKLKLYKIADKEFAARYLKEIKRVYEKLCQKIKQKI